MVRGSKGCSSKPPNPQPCPWLMYSHGRHNNIQTFYSLSDNRCLKRRLPDLSHKFIHAISFENWMVITYYAKDSDENEDSSRNCFLLNMASFEKIWLLKVVVSGSDRCILSSSPLEADCIVAFFSSPDQDTNIVRFWRQNQQDWVERILDDNVMECTMCNGKIYGLINYDNLAIVEIRGNNVQVKPVNVEQVPRTRIGGMLASYTFLLESCGNIFVVRHVMLGASFTRIYTIEVYKLMETETRIEWVQVKDIGDRVFFLNKQPGGNFSCSATEIGLKKNTIYFIGSKKDNDLYEYNMEENRLYKTLPCIDVVNHIRLVGWVKI